MGKAMGKGNAVMESFVGAFYQQVPIEDLKGWNAEDLTKVLQGLCDWGMTRKKGEQKVRVFNPDLKKDGWYVPSTVIQIVNDDRPFIVDSVSSELAHRGLHIQVLFHPMLSVERDGAGRKKTVDADRTARDGFIVESYIHIQLEQILPDDVCKDLSASLLRILDDVFHATGDWRSMLEKVESVATGLSRYYGGYTEEGREFLKYLANNNFTFLGYRYYSLDGQKLTADRAADMGVVKAIDHLSFDGQEQAIATIKKSPWPVAICKLMDHPATVHRRVPMDAIVVKDSDQKGQILGLHVFTGLFTSSTYSCRTSEIPMARQKVRATIERAGFAKGGHDYKALEHILEKLPRDELFQVTADELYQLSLGILRLQKKHQVGLFAHQDPFGQYMSCLVYVPRDKYNARFRERCGHVIEEFLKGKLTNFFTTLDDSPLARLLFTVRLKNAAEAKFDYTVLETKVVDLAREWDEKLKHYLVNALNKSEALALSARYGRAFPQGYCDVTDADRALWDIRHLDAIITGKDQIRIELYRMEKAPAGEFHLKVYNAANPVSLSDILPVLENMGLRSVSEMPYDVHPAGTDKTVWIHDFTLQGAADIALDVIKKNFEETFLEVWRGVAENDGLNKLVTLANLQWREVRMLRAYGSFMRQARFPYSRHYMEEVLSSYPLIVQSTVDLFKSMHDPALSEAQRSAQTKAASEKITGYLKDVQKLDHDRILRQFRTVIEKTLRTNYFQTDDSGAVMPVFAVKLDSKNIPDLPLPRPHVEMFVYSRRVEAVHLRFGEIARGGIRWSDRHDDFRTEILGLVKSQMVKNTVIVPVGAKGGFVVKNPPKTGGREAYQQEGIECYKIFVQAMLDLTDNNVKGKILRPQNVVCHDGIDPYLVVAADKGTATFSDIANSLSLKSKFWLGDAFASGGSAGYDHKKMGITARGGWESVKRHFREMGKDIQSEPFTLVGVGDMAGDVFGNAMLLSRQMKLQGAFNHVHVFCDPNPDIAVSFAERERLFKARGGWDAYDKAKLSKGGAIFERSAKVVKLTPEIKSCFGIKEDQVTPDELVRAILKANVELIWFGGIGTFLKSSKQSHADADDKSNDALRIDANEVRAKVIGEGANLGVTQLARVEYAQLGGRINTDFIDNSAGVDCSDHEVNIKILLSDVVAKDKLNIQQRNRLLEQMTDDVAQLVLRDNYQQTQSLTLQQSNAREQLALHAELIRALEKSGMIKRQLEGLPDDETIAGLARDGRGLTRPELSILMSWSKIVLYNQMLASKLPDDPSLEWMLFDYFPKALHKYKDEILQHKLRREIIATQLVNILVNRMGSVFVQSRMIKTGATAEEVMRAFVIVMEVFDLRNIWQAIENMDNKVSGTTQIALMDEVFDAVKRVVTWFLRFNKDKLDVVKQIDLFKPNIQILRKSVLQFMSGETRALLENMEKSMKDQGVSQAFAKEMVAIKALTSACDIINISQATKRDVGTVAEAYFLIGDRLHIDWLKHQAASMVPLNGWQAQVIGGVMDDLYAHQAFLAAAIIRQAKKTETDGRKAVLGWFEGNADKTARADQTIADIQGQKKPDLDMLVLASQRIGHVVLKAEH